VAAGFEDTEVYSHKVVLTYPGVRDFLRAVKEVGANTSQQTNVGLGQRRLLTEMIHSYERAYGSERGIPVTYDLIYIRAIRGRNLSKKMES
jgi:malonyl-CoA O-methyltransferase